MMLVASSNEQSRVADILCNTSPGAELLLQFVEQGTASARLLVDPKRNGILRRVLDKSGIEKLTRLTDGVVADAGKAETLIAARRNHFRSGSGSPAAGRAIFEKQCMICHQVGNEGKPFAPNLDGIGSRGLERLLEDVLDPNRNVDIAFRAQTVVTEDGQVFSGLVKEASNEQILLIESTGIERSINDADIAEQSSSNLSPMPANLGEVLSEKEFTDLLAYLLSLTNS